MRHRWIPRTLPAMAFILGACAPQQGTDASDAPSEPPASVAAASQGPEPTDSPEPSEAESTGATPTTDPTPPDYDY